MASSSKERFRSYRRSYRDQSAALDDLDSNDKSANDPSQPRRYLREYIGWLRPFALGIGGVLLLAFFSAGLSLILPRATMYIVDVVLPAKDARMLNLLGASLILIIILQQSFDFWRNWSLSRLNSRVVFRLRQRLYAHLLKLPLQKLSEMKTGGIIARLSGDVDSVTGLLQMAIITPCVAGAKIIMTLVLLFTISWQMALGAVILLPPIVALNMLTIRRIRPIYRSIRRDRSEIDGRVVETFGGIRDVRAFRREAAEAKRYALGHHTVIRKQLLARLFEHIVASGWGFLIPATALLVIWLGGTLYFADKATVGGIIAFQMYIVMLLMPVSMIVHSYGQTQQSLAAMERVFDLLRQPIDKPDRPGAVNAPRPVQSIEFDNVTFAYRESQPVLRSITLQVSGGSTIALVGPSGAGKTTLTNLIARFHDPDSGAIRLNGIDLRDLKLRSYRSLLGLVQQDVFLFDGSVAENIAYGRTNASDAEIEEAARRANAHDFIMQFPEGYETIVGERGVRLSGGQAQRVSIARAILADPPILILDEATSNLDTQSEQLIQESLARLSANRTTFVIAHRLSTVMSADLIVVIEDGQITETGTHPELMTADGRYRAMVERQQRSLDETKAGADWLA
ncbi:MAG: ABC transporter ATP-binding protein [Planctomycetes bacterium]|nr:ABC transporter ATP-binding protein [Planctomycetota bacterium]